MTTAWKVWKDCAYPGEVIVPGSRGPLTYRFTPADMAALERSGNAKVRDYWNIPLCWEHQDVEPTRVRMSRGEQDRDFARGVFGRIERFARTPDGRLKALLAGDDPADLAQLRKVGFVSPQIDWDWTDTEGRLWPGPSVTHLAATPRPVQRFQHPVGTDPDAPPPRPTPADSLKSLVRMSFGAGPKNAPGVGSRIRLSIDHYTRTPGSAPMADELTTTGLPGDGVKKDLLTKAMEAAQKLGLMIGDDVEDLEHFVDRFCVAVETKLAHENPEDELDDLPEDADLDQPDQAGDMGGPPPGAIEPPMPPVQMSQTAAGRKLLEMHREKLVGRAERLARTGKVPPVVGNELVARANKVRLSLTAAGELAPTDVGGEIAAYERLPANRAWTPGGKVAGKNSGGKTVRLSQRGGVRPADDSPYRESSPQDDEAIVAAFFATGKN